MKRELNFNGKSAAYISEAVLTELGKNYPEVGFSAENGTLLLDSDCDEQLSNAELDISFLIMNPRIPIENVCNRIDNFEPKTGSQEELLEYTKRLLDLDETACAGIFVYGGPGTGKTHLAIASAKELMKKNQPVTYLSPESGGNLPLGPGIVYIFDDLNSPFGVYMDHFKKAVLNAHNYGGRIFATSNTDYDTLLDNAFVTDPDEKQRLMDRIGHMFKVIPVYGTSQRQKNAWYL